jgi:hypothetical protein
MLCTDVRKLLPDLALGDLDAEPAAEVSAHLAACAACRTESGTLGRTVKVLRAALPAAPSTERRSAAVAAMARAHAEQSERLLTRRPRSWAPWATAAAFLLALAAALSVRGGGTAFTVAKVTGKAELRDPETGRWRPVFAGVKISVGDRLLTYRGCILRLSAGATDLCLDEETSVEVVAARRVTLDRGRLLAIARDSSADALVVTDPANNAVRVTGRVELSLREVSGQLAGSFEQKGTRPVLPDPKVQIERSLVVRVQSGEAALDGSREQRLRASAGQEGTFELGGKPATAPAGDGAIGDWAEQGFEGRQKE